MSFKSIKDYFLNRDKSSTDNNNNLSINDNDLKVIMIKDYFNHKQRGSLINIIYVSRNNK